MPDLQADYELAAFLQANGYDKAPGAVREWREHGYFPPRMAPGTGRGRRRSEVSDEDRAIALGLAKALGSLPRTVTLTEAAVAAWGLGAPIFHGRPGYWKEGLRSALASEMAHLATKAADTFKLATGGSRKARAAILNAAPTEAGREVLRAALGKHVDPVTAATGLGATPELLEETGLVWRNPHDPRALQALPKLARFFEGSGLLVTLAETAKFATSERLEECRDMAAVLLDGPMRRLWEHGLGGAPADVPPGWEVGIFACGVAAWPRQVGDVLVGLSGTRQGRRQLESVVGRLETPQRPALPRGRPPRRQHR